MDLSTNSKVVSSFLESLHVKILIGLVVCTNEFMPL